MASRFISLFVCNLEVSVMEWKYTIPHASSENAVDYSLNLSSERRPIVINLGFRQYAPCLLQYMQYTCIYIGSLSQEDNYLNPILYLNRHQ